MSDTQQPADITHPGADQLLLFARDLARLQDLRRHYQALVPQVLNPDAPAVPTEVVADATVLFTDLRGFTGLSERFAEDPDRLLSVLNEHLTIAVRAITRCGGTIEKFVGDGILATFGVRQEMPDHRARSIAAAVGVVGANEALVRRRTVEWGFRLDVGIGVVSGKVVTGRIGPPERSEMGVLGDPINVAARLVATARSGEILLSASTYQGVAGAIVADLVGEQVVRGRAGGVSVFRLAPLGTVR